MSPADITRNTTSRSRVIAITSGKGGVGKTSVSINVSVTLAKAGMRVLLIDADMGLANVDLMAGVSAPHAIEEVLAGDASIFDALTEGPEGITILPAGSGIGTVHELGQDRLTAFRGELVKLENAFDIIFIDTGAGISANVVDFVFMADEVTVVMTPEPTAFADAYAMVKVVSREKPGMDVGIIVNMVKNDKEASLVFSKFHEIVRRFLNRGVILRGGIVRDAAVSQAVMRQVPLAISAAKSPAMQSIRGIARNFLGNASPQPGTIFNR